MGLEAILAKELRQLGYNKVIVSDGKVEFDGDLTDICKANLWLRTAGRIYIKIAQFHAITFDELFNHTKPLTGNAGSPKMDISCNKSKFT